MECDSYTAETKRNYNAGTGTRQNTSAQARKLNMQAFQRRMAQQKSRMHVDKPNRRESFLEPGRRCRGFLE